MSQLLRKVALPIALGLLSGCSTVDGVMDTAGGWVSGSSADSVPKLEPLQAELHPTIQWSETIGEGTSGLIVRLIPQLVDGPLGVTLYSAAVDGTVSAIALPSGKERWHVEYSERIMSGVVVDSHNLYFGSESGQLVALDRESGEERWSLSLLSEILAPVAVAGERVVVRTVDGKISAVNRLSGEKLWHYEREVPVLTLRGTGSPVIVGQQVIVGLDSGEVVALSLEGGREQWLKSVTSARGRTEIERMVDIDADPVVKEDMVYVVGYQGELAALSRTDGALRWKRKVSGVTAPMVYGPYLFLTDQEGNVWAFDRKDGSALWKQDSLVERGPTTPLLMDKSLVIADSTGYLHWISAEDGHLQGRIKLDSAGISAPPLKFGNAVVSYGNSGKLALITD